MVFTAKGNRRFSSFGERPIAIDYYIIIFTNYFTNNIIQRCHACTHVYMQIYMHQLTRKPRWTRIEFILLLQDITRVTHFFIPSLVPAVWWTTWIDGAADKDNESDLSGETMSRSYMEQKVHTCVQSFQVFCTRYKEVV